MPAALRNRHSFISHFLTGPPAKHRGGSRPPADADPEEQPGEAGEGLAAAGAGRRDARKSCHSALMRTPWVAPVPARTSPLGP